VYYTFGHFARLAGARFARFGAREGSSLVTYNCSSSTHTHTHIYIYICTWTVSHIIHLRFNTCFLGSSEVFYTHGEFAWRAGARFARFGARESDESNF